MGLEAAAIGAAAAGGLAVPELVAVDDGSGLGSAGMVMARVEGETLARRILRDPAFAGARAALTGQLASFLAGLHRMYFDPIQFKRSQRFVNRMQVAPDSLSPRLLQFRRHDGTS